MKLIGSTTSPYVRRIRILLDEEPYEFVNLNIYGEGRDELRRNNPTLKIPVLEDGGQEIYDSRIIARYISAKRDGGGRSVRNLELPRYLSLLPGGLARLQGPGGLLGRGKPVVLP